MQDILSNDQDPFRLTSLLEADEAPAGDLWNGMELADVCRPSRGPTPAINMSSMSVPVTIAGGRRSAAGTAANDSAESTGTMLGLSYEDPKELANQARHDPAGAWSAPAAWNSHASAWKASMNMVPQHAPHSMPWLDAAASVGASPYMQQYHMQVMAAMTPSQQQAAYGHPISCSVCPSCSLRFVPGSAPATDGSWAPSAPGHGWAPTGSDGRDGYGAWPMAAAPGAAPSLLTSPHAAAAGAEMRMKDVPVSEGSTMQCGRSRASYSTMTEQDSVHDDEFERTGSLDILSFDASDDDVLRLESGPLELGEAAGASAAARSSTPVAGTPCSAGLLAGTPNAGMVAAGGSGASRGRGGVSPLLPPSQPAARGLLFTQHHTGARFGSGSAASPAGAPRGLAPRPTAALKRSGSARRLGSTLDLDALTLAGGEGSFSTGSAAASAAAGAYALADRGSAACLAGPPGSPRGSSGRPVRQAARRSMAFSAAAAAAEAWDDEAYAPPGGAHPSSQGGSAGALAAPAAVAASQQGGWYARGGDVGAASAHDEGSVHGGGRLGAAFAGSGTLPGYHAGGGLPPALDSGAAGREKKKHNPWTTEETRALVAGVRLVGVGRWAEIKRAGGAAVAGVLAARSAVDLKDKWRNLARVARLPRAALRQRLAKGSEVPMDVVLEVQELLEMARIDRTGE